MVCVDFLAVALLASGLVPRRVWLELNDAAAGAIEPRMAGACFVLAATLGVLAIARVRFGDLGAGWRRLPSGFALAAVAWLAIQGILAVWLQVVGERADVLWPTPGEFSFFAMAAFREELVCRAVLLLWLVDATRRRGWQERTVVAVSLGLSSAVFALDHLPFQLAIGASPSAGLVALAGHVEMGLLFGALMLITRNLWAVTIVHVVVNVRPGLQGTEALTPWFDVYAVAAVLIAAGWAVVGASSISAQSSRTPRHTRACHCLGCDGDRVSRDRR